MDDGACGGGGGEAWNSTAAGGLSAGPRRIAAYGPPRCCCTLRFNWPGSSNCTRWCSLSKAQRAPICVNRRFSFSTKKNRRVFWFFGGFFQARDADNRRSSYAAAEPHARVKHARRSTKKEEAPMRAGRWPRGFFQMPAIDGRLRG